MKQSKCKKRRTCQHCAREIFGDAEQLKEHVAMHQLADRAQKSGLVLPETEVSLPHNHGFLTTDGRLVTI